MNHNTSVQQEFYPDTDFLTKKKQGFFKYLPFQIGFYAILPIAYIYFLDFMFSSYTTLKWILIGIIIVGVTWFLIGSYLNIEKEFNTLTYTVDDHEIIKESGHKFYVKTVIPFNKINHFEVHQDLKDRKYGLKTIAVQASSTSYPEELLEGLSLNDAQIIENRIQKKLILLEAIAERRIGS